jgi:hypothetical protein
MPDTGDERASADQQNASPGEPVRAFQADNSEWDSLRRRVCRPGKDTCQSVVWHSPKADCNQRISLRRSGFERGSTC